MRERCARASPPPPTSPTTWSSKGLPFRDAHEAVGWPCARRELGRRPAATDARRAAGFLAAGREDVFAVLTVEGSLAARDHIGGTAPEQVLAPPSPAPVAGSKGPSMEKIGKYESSAKSVGRHVHRLSRLRPFHPARRGDQGGLPEDPADPERGKLYTHLFLNEASLVGKLMHPHIVQIFDAVVAEDLCYIVMEYVPAARWSPSARPAETAARRARGRDHLQVHAGARFRLPARHHPPRHQAGQHPARRHRPERTGDIKISDFGAAITGGVAPRSRASAHRPTCRRSRCANRRSTTRPTSTRWAW
jgi:hypothetical protein